MILVLDNYDSFTYNLVQLIGRVTGDVAVRRNDEVSAAEIQEMRPAGIVISPGPGRPESAGVTIEVIRALGSTIPVFGVCLGHQAIGAAYGGEVIYAPSLMHGRTSMIRHRGVGIFAGVPDPFVATRYHSLVISPDRMPAELEVTAWTDDGVIMGVRHRTHPVEGVQFHPESILTEQGERLIRNWMEAKQCP
jgi:anthranilate synthase/aminodeoxychorismate synthase-like glutamine amidotransferase